MAMTTTPAGRSMSTTAVDVGPGCEGLPLLELASDAGDRRQLSVHVRRTDVLPAGTLGALVVDGGQAWVLLDRDADGAVWAHEVAHLVDGIDGRVARRGARTWRRRERFADRLGPLLLEHEPVTVQAAAPLIHEARRR